MRLLLLPIVFAGDRLVAHPLVGTAGFNVVFFIACVYAGIALLENRLAGPHVPLWVFGTLDLLFVCALTYESGGAFSQLHWAFVCLPLGSAILLDPRRTVVVSFVTTIAYLIVAVIHPSTADKQLDLILVRGLYIAWVGVAAVVFSTVLARREAQIRTLAADRGRLIGHALAAEENARKQLADNLHDVAIQNLLAARQDLAEAREGDDAGVARAENAVRATLDQLRTTVHELHPYGLAQLGLETALGILVEQQASRGGYVVRTRIDSEATGVEDQLVFSLTRELLVNVTRHARANRVELEVARQDQAIVLTVSDNGCGVDDQQLVTSLRQGHIGLASCRERVHAVEGRMSIRRRNGGGTWIRCVLPLPEDGGPTASDRYRSLVGRSS